MESLTFEALLTAAGAGIAATLVTLTVSVIKTGLGFTANWDGALMCFVISAVFYVLAGVHIQAWVNLDTMLGVFIAWLTCASSAVGVHKLAVNPLLDRVANKVVP